MFVCVYISFHISYGGYKTSTLDQETLNRAMLLLIGVILVLEGEKSQILYICSFSKTTIYKQMYSVSLTLTFLGGWRQGGKAVRTNVNTVRLIKGTVMKKGL